jgi:hypothetical protein
VKGSNSDKWKEAMKDEMKELERNATWDLVELPRDRKTLGFKWFYKLKKGVDDKVERYKARLVAKDILIKKVLNFMRFFHVVKTVSIRIVLALVALLGLELEQLDVKTAFLHGHLNEEIYMEQPEGFVQIHSKKFVCSLKKLNNDIFIILVFHVDDMLLARKNIIEINKLKAQMARTFDMKDLGAAR